MLLHAKIAGVKKLVQYLKEVKFELTKVVWPKKDQVVKLTLVILIISVAVGAYLGTLDVGFTKLLEILVSR